MSSTNMRLLPVLLLTSLFFLSGCTFFNNLFGGGEEEEQIANPFIDNLDIDPYTGVQYYLPYENVNVFSLPDGTPVPMVLIPGGDFIMGLTDVDPLAIQASGRVRITVNAFWMGQFEVTNGQYRAFLRDNSGREAELLPDSTAWEREVGIPWRTVFYSEEFSDYPVVAVSYDQAREFADWAGMRLPYESEWEYAARSGVSGRVFPWDGIYYQDQITGQIQANFAPRGDKALDGYVLTAPVGEYPANNFRLYDMAGNVAEWIMDAYYPSYSTLQRTRGELITPRYVSDREPRKIVRGGSWASDSFFIGVGARSFQHKDQASARVGFRVVRDVDDPSLLLGRTGIGRGINRVNPRQNLQQRQDLPSPPADQQRPMQQQQMQPVQQQEQPVVPPPPPPPPPAEPDDDDDDNDTDNDD